MQGNNVILSNRLDFGANQKVFGYFYNFNAIIASVGIACQATHHCNLQLGDIEEIFGGLNCYNLAHKCTRSGRQAQQDERLCMAGIQQPLTSPNSSLSRAP